MVRTSIYHFEPFFRSILRNYCRSFYGIRNTACIGNIQNQKIETTIVEKDAYTENFLQNASPISELALSKRELEVLELLAKGQSNQEIATQLYISLSTVKTQNQNIFEKLGIKPRTQAVEKAKPVNLIA